MLLILTIPLCMLHSSSNVLYIPDLPLPAGNFTVVVVMQKISISRPVAFDWKFIFNYLSNVVECNDRPAPIENLSIQARGRRFQQKTWNRFIIELDVSRYHHLHYFTQTIWFSSIGTGFILNCTILPRKLYRWILLHV